MSMCRVISCVVGRGCLLWPMCSLGKSLLAFALLHFVLQCQTCLLLQVSLDFLLLHSSCLWWKGHLFGVSSRKSCSSSQNHSVIFENAPKYCISDCSVDYEGDSMSSKGFLPTVINIMAIWIKFAHSRSWIYKMLVSILSSPAWPQPIYLDSWT